MASVHARLAWTVPVPVARLGVHLQAYVDLLPVINTLRLCNRYGKGMQVAVTKLPVEIVTVIERYLIDDTRAQLRDERVDVYKDALNNRELPPPASIEFTDEELDVIEDASQNDLLSTVVSMSWEDRHYANCKEWEGKTGTPAESSRGFFSKHAIVLKAHLGLEVLIRHTLRTGNNTGRWSDDVWGIHAYKSTSAYLTWPGASFEENFHQRDEVFAEVSSARFFSGDELYSPTESSFAMPIALPSQLPGKSLARFARALEILDIQPEGEDEARREMLFARKRDKKAMEASVKQPTEGVEVQPQLMFLMRVDDRASPSI